MEPPLSSKMFAYLTILMLATSAATLVSADPVLPSLKKQAGALLAWKATLSNHSQDSLQSWGNMPSAPCGWRGIRCAAQTTRRHRLVITVVSLRGLKLRGSLESMDFSALSTLTTLDLSHNKIAGSIPSSIGHLRELHALLLHRNQIRGSIPPSIGNLTKLITLRLSNNELVGSVPQEIGNLVTLKGLNLSVNQLEDHIPTSIGNLTQLSTLRLDTKALFVS
ncbi:putative LRR receptor-like serine/threonine-protein kinase [Hordeum vulgare]|nr:putative LRR receptor-like serine/threonine-protein kinase [Hordeum vulgare]